MLSILSKHSIGFLELRACAFRTLFGILVQKWEKDYEPTTIKSDDETMFQVKCADCGCLPEECKHSPSAKECSNCSWDECCCWATITSD